MIEAVVFDVDGTLVDSVDQHTASWQAAFQHFGKEIPFEHIRRQIGKGADQLMPAFLSKKELDEFGEQLDKFRGDLFKREYLPSVRAFPQARELLERVRKDDKRIALASSAKADELQAYKKIAGIEDLIDVQTSSKDAEVSKPYPDIFAAALRQLGPVNPGAVMVVGDTPWDAEAAARANLRAIGLLCGGWPEQRLREAGCVAIYRDPADLLRHYDRSPLSRGSGTAAL